MHERRERFGFRTFEVRPRDGVYLNGRKIVLKGINRHSFSPKTGRTLTREQNYRRRAPDQGRQHERGAHVALPARPAFLEAADELGLYVLDELAGWQGFYDTPTGARLIGQIVRRDVNHPSILFWDNGNEGGWNRENDGEFDRWDPQRRPVLHPWAIFSGINTDHYENYDSTVKLSAGPDIFMPTEFLHGLYDGGIGAGFRDYWDVMGRSPTVAGGFFWAFADEGIERTDQNGRIDNMGNSAPDGIVGAHHEKEGSYFAVKEIWSPVELSELNFADRRVSMNVANHYDFTNLSQCTVRWRALRMPAAGLARRGDNARRRPRAAAGSGAARQHDLATPGDRQHSRRERTARTHGARSARPGFVDLGSQGHRGHTTPMQRHPRIRKTRQHRDVGQLLARVRSGHRHAREAHRARSQRSAARPAPGRMATCAQAAQFHRRRRHLDAAQARARARR